MVKTIAKLGNKYYIVQCDLCGSTEDVEIYNDIALCPKCAKILERYIDVVNERHEKNIHPIMKFLKYIIGRLKRGDVDDKNNIISWRLYEDTADYT